LCSATTCACFSWSGNTEFVIVLFINVAKDIGNVTVVDKNHPSIIEINKNKKDIPNLEFKEIPVYSYFRLMHCSSCVVQQLVLVLVGLGTQNLLLFYLSFLLLVLQLQVKIIEDWKQALDQNKYIAAVLMDLSKAFDCLPHKLLLL
jgi:hypothetical protein